MKSLGKERAAAERRLLLFDAALPRERIRRFQEEEAALYKRKREIGAARSVLL